MLNLFRARQISYPPVRGEIRVTDPEVQDKLAFHGLTEEDLGVITRWRDACERRLEHLLDQFYAKAGSAATPAAILQEHSSMEKQRPMLRRYFQTFLMGRVDDAYVAYRRRVGAIHDGIDLDSHWFIGMYEVIQRCLVEAVTLAGARPRERRRFEEALNRLVEVDIALVVTALTDSRRTKVENLTSAVREQRDAAVNFLGEASQVLERVAARDLTARVTGQYEGDYEAMQDALNTAVQNLDEALALIGASVDQVAAAAGEINGGSQTLAQGTSEQASALEEVSSNLNEMASMSRRNSTSAREANGLAEGALRTAEEGMEKMRRLSSAVDRIKTSADSTAKIVKTIDEIAFQTNLLALNAAVEAARAGEAGKGFAVVAEEVRNLAMRSAEAARNTAGLIEDSVRSVEEGVALNGDVLHSLEEINGQMTQVREMMAEITTSSTQQTQGVDQIHASVEQISHITQQTAAHSEESAGAAEELSSQAEVMRNLTAQFRLSAGSGGTVSMRELPGKAISRSPVRRKNGSGYTHTHDNGNGRSRVNRLHAESLIPFLEDEGRDADGLRDF